MQQEEEGTIQQAETEAAAETVSEKDVLATLQQLYGAVKSGGKWFYWVAGLSVINTLITLFHGNVAFIVGLGATQILDAVISEIGAKAAVIALSVNLVITGVYVLLGYFACQRMRWAFILGMVFYALDGLLFLLVKDWLPLAFHAFVLYAISRGLKAEGVARQIEAQAARSGISLAQ